jgi:hypothetical protein
MFQLWTRFDHFGNPSGFGAAVAQRAVENLRDTRGVLGGGTLLHGKLRAMSMPTKAILRASATAGSLSLVPRTSIALLGREHGRTIPLSDIGPVRQFQWLASYLGGGVRFTRAPGSEIVADSLVFREP